MNRNLPTRFYRMPANVIFFVGVPLFFFLFVLAYEPFGIVDFLSGARGHYTLNLIIASLTVLGVLSLSRMLIFILRRRLKLSWATYTLWCLGETVVSALMLSILMGISWAGIHPYFQVMSRCVLYLAAILVFPYIIFNLGILAAVLRDEALAPQADEKSLLRLYDENKRLKLIVSADAVLYIKAEENYVHIVHLDNGKVKDFVLRASMRSLEPVLERHSLVRCHRSYFVNATHVELVKKDSVGYALARLDTEGVEPVPVSKRYYQALSALL